ncbi:hypothetical protein [Flavihumibacter petaseus]|uniref:Lipoprotein n=1 Tax=Flavihumibacter petaseus NBRC 106054 TaxID=1220578 RepID=A0A0E9MVT3_9BACT|nr:hypothetical protein [Flavihumibacter petaseus]GAO41235.1 hypothetical protein FPE01S_01_02470 [Flavihumibacter petaseus NBRC 106054]
MRKLTGALTAIVLILSVLFISCGKESATVTTARPADLVNLEPGKYIIYQLDSLVKSNDNDTAMVIHSYQARDVIDAQITDNLGRPSWRVFRYLRDINSTDESAWAPNDTYLITPTDRVLEWIDNNQRFVKLSTPFTTDFTWKGNSYINTTPGDPLDYLQNWDYSYTSVDEPFTLGDLSLDSCTVVLQNDEGVNYANDRDPQDMDSDGYRIYSLEVYAKHIGLVYKELIHWDFQKRTLDNNGQPALPNPYGNRVGEGIRLRMLSHN